MSSRDSFRPKISKPKSISEILNRTMGQLRVEEGKLTLKNKLRDYAIFPLWSELVGEEIAKVSKPEKIIRRKILVVRVIDAAWAQELSIKKELLLEKLRLHSAGARITDLRFITGDPQLD